MPQSQYSLFQAYKGKGSQRTHRAMFLCSLWTVYSSVSLKTVLHILFVTAKNSTTPNPHIKTAEGGLPGICFGSWSYLQTFCLYLIQSVSQSSWSLCQIDFRFKRKVDKIPKPLLPTIRFLANTHLHTILISTDGKEGKRTEKMLEHLNLPWCCKETCDLITKTGIVRMFHNSHQLDTVIAYNKNKYNKQMPWG